MEHLASARFKVVSQPRYEYVDDMKDHKKVTKRIHLELEVPYGTLSEAIAQCQAQSNHLINELETASKGLKNVTVVDETRWDGRLVVTGWKPMTKAEKEAAARRSEAGKKAAAKQKQKQAEKDEKDLERLAKKLGKKIT